MRIIEATKFVFSFSGRRPPPFILHPSLKAEGGIGGWPFFPFYPTTQPPKGGKAWGAPLGTGVPFILL